MPDRSGKLTKKVLSLLIALCLIATILPAVTAEGRETPFAAKLAAGTVFYADQDLKTETGTLAKDAVVLVTEEKGRADHISYKQENKKTSAWVPKEAAAVLAATPTDLAPYLSDENLILTLPAPVTEEPADPVVIPDEGGDTPAGVIPGDTPADVIPTGAEDTSTDVIPTEAEDTPTDVIPSEAEGEVEESVDSPSEPGQEPEMQEPGEQPAEGGDTPTSVISDDTPSVIPTEVEESLVSPSETDPTSQEPGEALTDEPGEGPAEGESATPTDLEPEESRHGMGHIDEDTWEELLAQETAGEADDPTNISDEDLLPTLTYSVVDGELVTTAYIPYFYLQGNTAAGEGINLELPKVRDQLVYGTCWAFSAVGGMEIDLIKEGTATTSIDLSELYLAYFTAHDYDYPTGGMGQDSIDFTVYYPDYENYLDIGGNNTLAYRILANLLGVTTEDNNSYPDKDRTDEDKEPTSYAIAAQLTGAYLVDPEEHQAIKDMITAHGSIGASLWMPDAPEGYYSGFSGSGATTCLYGDYPRTNHDILLVGWDDDFAVANFTGRKKPQNPGAWLVRNSWGYNGWGVNGYFWVSYEDASINYKQLTVYDATNDTTAMDDYSYSYDRAPYPYEYVSSGKNSATTSQQFTIRGGEKIQAIGVDTASSKLNVSVKVTAGTDTATGSVENVREGFYRIPLDHTISLSAATTVTVEVTFTARETDMEIWIPYQPVGTDSSLRSSSGRYSFTGGQDGGFSINGTAHEGDPCIKIYTKSTGEKPVTGISLDSSALPAQAQINTTYQLLAHVLPTDADNQHIYWASSDPNVAYVDKNGLITTGNTHGEAVITATTAAGDFKATCKVLIPTKEPDSIKIDGLNGASTYTINNENAGNFWFGSTLTMSVKITPSYATERKVAWSSSNSSVLKLTGTDSDGNARFVAMGNGSTTITVSHTKGDGTVISDKVQIIIDLHRYVSSVSLDRTSASISEDETLKLNATVSPADAENKGVIWTSSNSDIASVDGAGYVYGQGWGTAVITVTTLDGSKTASCTVEVTPRDLVQAFVFRMYRVCLQRDPDEGGFRYWVDQLNSGKKTGAEAVFNFYDSKEMKNRNLPNDQYLTRLYEGIMGRAPDAGGYAYWMQIMETGMSRPYVISGFLTSKEFDNLCRKYGINKGSYSSSEPRDQNPGVTGFVSRLYTKLLGRSFDDNGLNYWCRIVLKEPTRATLLKVALDGFLHSKEFLNKHLGDTDYLMVLYRTFLDREAEPGGLNYWLGKMRSGMSRDKVAEGFANSQEFKNIMARYGFNK